MGAVGAQRAGAACFGGCSWCWRLVGRVSGAYPPTCVLRRPPPLLAAALRAPLVVAGSAAATVATAWSRPSQRTRAALLILPRAADRRCSGRAWWRQTARARWISRATCSCAGAPRRHLIAWLRLLSIDLQLDGAMSSPGPAAKLALKRQTGLMGGDMGLAATTAAAQAQRSVSAAQPVAVVAAAVAATGAYDLQAMARASQSLPVVPARSSTTGRPPAPTHPVWLGVGLAWLPLATAVVQPAATAMVATTATVVAVATAAAVTTVVSAAAQHQRRPAQGRRQSSH